MSKENPKTKWGDRDSIRMVYNDWEVKVANAAEAERIIKKGMMLHEKKIKVCSKAKYTRQSPPISLRIEMEGLGQRTRSRRRNLLSRYKHQPSGDKDSIKQANPLD